jgi:hypothetical protein
MNTEIETRRSIETWLADEIDVPTTEDVLDAARRRVAATRQRRRWLATLRVDRQAFAMVRLVGAGAGVAATIVLAAMLVAPGSRPAATDEVTPTPEPTKASAAPGSQAYRPRITYMTPTGRRITVDGPLSGRLESGALVPDASFDVCVGPIASEPTRNVPAPGVGRSADALIEHLARRSDYRIVTGPIDMEIDGLQGAYLDIEGLPATRDLNLLANGDGGPLCRGNLFGTERLRLGFLDLPDGTAMSIGVRTFSGLDVIARGWQVVDSFKIDRTSLASPTP